MTAIILILAIPTFAANISESDVKSFLSNWLAAQNAGSFTNYSVMYAQEFSGIKRSGKQTTSFNRNAWLEDRKRMFKSKMKVSASNVQINALGSTATVKIEQTWESQGYKDKGEKQLYLVLEKNGLKIKREEMIASKVLAGKGMVLDSSNFPFAFAIREGVVIENVDIKPEYINSKPQLSSRDPYFVAISGVNTQFLPTNIKSLIGMPVKIYSAKGMCESKIDGFKYVVKDIPSAATIQRWKEETTPVSTIIKTVLSEGYRHLVATTGKCVGDFAKDARLKDSPIGVGQKVDKEMENKVWKAFKALPLYEKTIKPYEDSIDIKNIVKFKLILYGKTYTWVSILVVAGNPYCGEEGGETLGVLWEVVRSGRGYDLKEVTYLDDQVFDYVTDIDNDGKPDFHYKEIVSGNDPRYFGFVVGNKPKELGLHFEEATDLRFEEAALNDTPC